MQKSILTREEQIRQQTIDLKNEEVGHSLSVSNSFELTLAYKFNKQLSNTSILETSIRQHFNT